MVLKSMVMSLKKVKFTVSYWAGVIYRYLFQFRVMFKISVWNIVKAFALRRKKMS